MSRLKEYAFMLPIKPLDPAMDRKTFDGVHKHVRDFMFKHFHGCTFRVESLMYEDENKVIHTESYMRYSAALEWAASITPKLMATEAARQLGMATLYYSEGEVVDMIEIKPIEVKDTEVKAS